MGATSTLDRPYQPAFVKLRLGRLCSSEHLLTTLTKQTGTRIWTAGTVFWLVESIVVCVLVNYIPHTYGATGLVRFNMYLVRDFCRDV